MGNLGLRKRVVASMALIGGFVALFAILLFTYSLPDRTPELLMPLIYFHFEFMMFMVALGVAVGAASFWLMREEVEIQVKESKINAELALSLLNPDERKAVGLLLKNDGECLQADVARIEGMTRLKAHRTAQNLARRNIVALDKRGKAVELKLAENVYDALKN